jgi:hypothetical protein
LVLPPPPPASSHRHARFWSSSLSSLVLSFSLLKLVSSSVSCIWYRLDGIRKWICSEAKDQRKRWKLRLRCSPSPQQLESVLEAVNVKQPKREQLRRAIAQYTFL